MMHCYYLGGVWICDLGHTTATYDYNYSVYIYSHIVLRVQYRGQSNNALQSISQEDKTTLICNIPSFKVQITTHRQYHPLYYHGYSQSSRPSSAHPTQMPHWPLLSDPHPLTLTYISWVSLSSWALWGIGATITKEKEHLLQTTLTTSPIHIQLANTQEAHNPSK